MTAARRARLAILRCEDKARRADFRASTFPAGSVLAIGYAEIAAEYRTTAEEWRTTLRDLDEPLDAACEDCGAADNEDHSEDCDSAEAKADRADEADYDARYGR